MTLTSGFYDSLNGDRRYTAEQFGALFKGIFVDGVLKGVGDTFRVTPVSGNTVSIGSGRAWFNGIWVDNDTAFTITLEPAESVLNRYDSVVLEVDKTQNGRRAQFRVIKGSSSSSSPAYPSISSSGSVYRYELARIYRPKGVTSVATHHVTNRVGTSSTPWARSLSSIHDAIHLSNYPKLNRSVSVTDQILLGDSSGAPHHQDVAQFVVESLIALSPKNRNRAFRGKNLGSYITAAQKQAIRDGSFADLYIGDYWTLRGHNWRIAHFDYFYGQGGGSIPNSGATTKCVRHHVVLVPDTSLYIGRLHTSETTDMGYLGTSARKSGGIITQARDAAYDLFGTENVLGVPWTASYSARLGFTTSYYMQNSRCEILNESLVFGQPIAGIRQQQTSEYPHCAHNFHSRLALFELAPEYITSADNKGYWLSDLANSRQFVYVRETGLVAAGSPAHNDLGARPVISYGGLS